MKNSEDLSAIRLNTKTDAVQKAIYYITIVFTFMGIFALPKGHEIIGGLVTLSILVGFYNYLRNKQYNKEVNIYISIILILYAYVVLISYALHGDWLRLAKSLFFVSLFYAFMPSLKNIRGAIQAALVLGSILIGAISIYQYSNGSARPDGFTNAILFSQASLIFFLFNIYFFTVTPSIKIKLLLAISSFSTLIALYLSQSRGAWLALVIIVSAFLVINLIKNPKKYITLAVALFMLMTALFTQSDIIKKKVQAGVSDLSRAKQGQYNSSWGLRLVAWESAWIGIKEHPFVGVGKNNFHANKAEQVAKNQVSSLALHPALAHSHNQYFQSTLIRGPLGLLTLLLVLSIPLLIKPEDTRIKYLGISIAASYAIFGLSDVPFEHLNTMYLYALSMVVIYALLSVERTISPQ